MQILEYRKAKTEIAKILPKQTAHSKKTLKMKLNWKTQTIQNFECAKNDFVIPLLLRKMINFDTKRSLFGLYNPTVLP